MPTRLLREGILTSERVSKLSAQAELFFRKAMSVTDDYGRFEADLAILRARLYPRQLELISESMISEFLHECCLLELVRLYQVGVKKYLQLERFGQRVRNASRYPDPEGHWLSADVSNCPPLSADVSNCPPYSEADSKADADSKANAESYAEHTDDSAALTVERKGKRAMYRAGKAPSKTRPVAAPGATSAQNGRGGEKHPDPASRYTPGEIRAFRKAIRSELGPRATEAEVDERFAEYTAPRRPA